MNWLRLYDTILDDPKVQQLPHAVFRSWINLLCLASQSEPRGTLPNIGAIAFRLRISESLAKGHVKTLVTVGLLDETSDGCYEPHNWTGRQRVTDDVAQRVRKHRATVTSNEPVTLQSVPPVTLHETPLKRSRATDTETETDTEPPLPPEGENARAPDLGPIQPTSFRNLPRSPLPTEWQPDEMTLLMAHNCGLDGDQTTATLDRFRDYSVAKGNLNADWQAAARAWLKREPEFETTRVASGGNGTRPIPIRDNLIRHGEKPADDEF